MHLNGFKMDAYSIFLLDFGLDSTNFARCFLLNVLGNLSVFCVDECWGNPIKKEKSSDDRAWVKFVKPIDVPFRLDPEKRGSKNRRNVFKFVSGNYNDTYQTSSINQSLFYLVVTEISARVEITTQSFAAGGYRTYEAELTALEVLSTARRLRVTPFGILTTFHTELEDLRKHVATQELVQGSCLLFFQIFYLKLPTNITNCRSEQLSVKRNFCCGCSFMIYFNKPL